MARALGLVRVKQLVAAEADFSQDYLQDASSN
jgi:hypothetical protein